MKLKLEINEDIIKLIKNFNFERLSDKHYGLDTYSLWGGTYLLEQMALILGYQDKIIPQTLESPMGVRFEEEYENKMWEYDSFILENIVFLEEILHQFIDKGGIKPGIYTALDYNRIWEYKPFEKD